jgi:bifunctional non-homologous end joining protein LigD
MPAPPPPLPGAARGPQPDTALPPQLATAAAEAPTGDQWFHEIKLDGYRMLCRVEGGRARFFSRQGNDWTDRVGHFAELVGTLPVESALLDGELVVLDAQGRSSFHSLQNSLRGDSRELVYFVFDLLHLDGWDLRAASLEARKARLAELLAGTNIPRLRFGDHVVGNGPLVLEHARQLGVEGIVSKRRDRPYRSGRSADWLKIKCLQTDEFVVGGYTGPEGSRVCFGALILGRFNEQGKLHYAGRVGTGFNTRELNEMHETLKALHRPKHTFTATPPRERREPVFWVDPVLVVQVEFQCWTDEGILRGPSYRGVREDKPAQEVVHIPLPPS